MSRACQAGWLAMLPRGGLFVRTRRCVSTAVNQSCLDVLEARSAKRGGAEEGRSCQTEGTQVENPKTEACFSGAMKASGLVCGVCPCVYSVQLAACLDRLLPAAELVARAELLGAQVRGVANCQMCLTTFSGFSSGVK